MRGTVAKRIRRAARNGKIDYNQLKAQYLNIKRRHGTSKDKTPNVLPVSPIKFLGHRKPVRKTMPTTYSGKVAKPFKGWHEEFCVMRTNSPKWRGHLAATGKLQEKFK